MEDLGTLKEQHREQKLFPQLLQLRCQQEPRSVCDPSQPRHLGPSAPLLPTPRSHPGNLGHLWTGEVPRWGRTETQQGTLTDLPSSSARRRWPSSQYSSLRKRQQLSPEPLNSHPLLSLPNGDSGHSPDSWLGAVSKGAKSRSRDRRKGLTTPDCTELPVPIPSWGLEAPPAGSAEIEEHPAESVPGNHPLCGPGWHFWNPVPSLPTSSVRTEG